MRSYDLGEPVVSFQSKSKGLRASRTEGANSITSAGEDCSPSSYTGRKNKCTLPPAFVLFSPSSVWMRPIRLGED